MMGLESGNAGGCHIYVSTLSEANLGNLSPGSSRSFEPLPSQMGFAGAGHYRFVARCL